MSKLYLTETAASYPKGVEFIEDVLLDTDKRINVAQAIITFNPEDFEVTVDNTGSAFPMEMFSTVVNGKITITRGLPVVDVTGNGVKVSSLKIKGLKNVKPTAPNFTFEFVLGDANFSNVIINDGLGTATLDEVVNSTFIIKKKSDLNGDGVVGSQDLQLLLSLFGDQTGTLADINQDGIVDIRDISILLGEWDEPVV